MNTDSVIFRFALRKAFPVLLVIITLLQVLFIGSWDFFRRKGQIVEEKTAHVRQLSAILQTLYEETDQKKTDTVQVSDLFNHLMADVHLEQVVFTDESGLVRSSTRKQFNGESIDSVFDKVIPDQKSSYLKKLNRVKQTRSPQVLFDDNTGKIISLSFVKIVNEQSIRSIKTGGLVIFYDVSDAIESYGYDVLSTMGSSFVIILVFLSLGFGVFYILFRKRLTHVLDVTKSFGEGNLEARTRLTGGDELAIIAGSFNEMADRINTMAYCDDLTGLYNRRSFESKVNDITAAGKSATIIFIDMDGFKHVNDALGHSVGDKVLSEIGRRISNSCFSGCFTARLGGDEFVVLFLKNLDDEQIKQYATRLLANLSREYNIEGNTLRLSASIGISRTPQDGNTSSGLMKKTDAAMYEAKRKGKNRYVIINEKILLRMSRKNRMAHLLHNGLPGNEFFIVYQPIYSYSQRKVVGLEALLRWKNSNYPNGVSPVEFIPILEETGLIADVGLWVIERVCLQIKEWQRSQVINVPINVNISNKQLYDYDFDLTIEQIVKKYNIDHSLLTFELTESQVMDDPERMTALLFSLHMRGYGLAIDDFGTGYSSLSYLRYLPIDYIKVDKTFVSRIVRSDSDQSIVRTVLSLARDLNKKVVVEGVEDEETAFYLNQMGCDRMQGYFFSRPIEAESVYRLLLPNDPQAGSSDKLH